MNYDHSAVRAAYPNAVTIKDDEGVFDASGNSITIDNAKVEEEANKAKYKTDREREYPAIKDQLDLIFHSGLDAWKTKIQEIKTKYPKP